MNRNKMNNVHNNFQNITLYKRVLCVCSAGLLRSPTIARVLQEKYGYNTRSAGISQEYALVEVSDYLLEWADEVVCANVDHERAIQGLWPEFLGKIQTLNIPDDFDYMNENLVALIKERYKSE